MFSEWLSKRRLRMRIDRDDSMWSVTIYDPASHATGIFAEEIGASVTEKGFTFADAFTWARVAYSIRNQ